MGNINLITKNRILFFWVVLTLTASNSYGQDYLDKANDLVKRAIEFANNLKLFNQAFRMSTEEFNKTVKVVKGDKEDKSKTISKDKLNPLKIKKGEIKNLEWKPFIGFDDQLFPSAIIGLAFYKGATTPELEAIIRPIGIRFLSKFENIPIKYEIECSEKKYFDKISGHYLYDNANNQVLVNPTIPWNYEALAKIEASIPVTFTFRFFDDEGGKVEKAVTTYFRSITDCLLGYDETQLYYLSTAYIQEEHPEIDVILKEATNTKIVKQIFGYQGTTGDVDLQVAAVCRVLHDRGMNYSSITTTVGNGDGIFSQTIRTFASSIKTNQANCIDGTVVLASILRKMDIKTVMVLTDNHCFLGYYRIRDENGKGKDLVFLETTKLADSDEIDAAIEKAKSITDKTKKDKIINQGYINQHKYLLNEGMKTFNFYNSNKDGHFIAGSLDVDGLRKDVKPIPF